jgi:DNA polymerase
VPLRYYAAHTGRWGGDGKVNPQNFGRKSQIKKAVKAPPGHVLVDADSSQIEARTLAWLAGQWDLVEAFEAGIDTYRLMGGDIYGLEPDALTDMQRFVGKTAVLGCGFGCGDIRFQAQLKSGTPSVELPLDECGRIVNTYRRKNYKITELWYAANTALSYIATDRVGYLGTNDLLLVDGKKGILLPNGMYLQYPNLRWEPMEEDERPQWIYDSKRGKSRMRTKIYGASLVENFTQAVARVIVGEQMLAIAKRYKVALTVHDAVCAVVPIEEEAEGRDFVEACMRLRPTWAPDLPLNCEVGSGASYGDC